MRRIGLFCFVFCAVAGLSVAQQSPELQQQVAAAKEAAARNQQALRGYSWISKTEILVKGEVKNTKIESCQYGPDGTVQKTELSEPPQQQQSSGRRRRVKDKVVAKKTGEMEEEMKSAAALVQSYVPPSPDKLQAVVAAGGVSLTPSGSGTAVIRFANYEKSGDSLTLTLDTQSKALQKVSVATWLDEPTSAVTLEVDFQSLSDGTNYAATTVMAIPDKQIEVRIENSNYERLAH